MKTDKEFKNEVYARASKERARIKKRNRVIMTAVPCFVIALTAATAAVYHSTSFSMKDAMPAEQPINAENYVQTEGIPDGYKSAPLTSEDQECYQQPDIATDISSGSVKSGSSVVPTENHGAAVTTVDGDKKGDFDRLNCDFRAFPDKKGEKSNGTPDAIVISNREKLAEYLAVQEKYGILSEELKSELSDKDDEYFKNNTVVIITADCEYDLADCVADSSNTLTVSLKKSESERKTGCAAVMLPLAACAKKPDSGTSRTSQTTDDTTVTPTKDGDTSITATDKGNKGAAAQDLMQGITKGKGASKKPDSRFANVAASFALDLFKDEYKSGKNTLVSPLSVLTALAMTQNGSTAIL